MSRRRSSEEILPRLERRRGVAVSYRQVERAGRWQERGRCGRGREECSARRVFQVGSMGSSSFPSWACALQRPPSSSSAARKLVLDDCSSESVIGEAGNKSCAGGEGAGCSGGAGRSERGSRCQVGAARWAGNVNARRPERKVGGAKGSADVAVEDGAGSTLPSLGKDDVFSSTSFVPVGAPYLVGLGLFFSVERRWYSQPPSRRAALERRALRGASCGRNATSASEGGA